MEEEATGAAAEAQAAPPGDVAADAAVAVAEAPAAEAAPQIDVTQLPDFNDPAATEAWIAAATEATNAAAADAETAERAAVPPTTAEAATIAAAPPSERGAEPTPADQPDYAAILADLQAKGFKVEPPPPPPDPYETLTAQLAPFVGTAEQYAEAKAQALVPIPPMPADNDLAWQEKYDAREAAIKARDQAAATLQTFDRGRAITDTSRAWARQRVMGELGSALEQVPAKYGLDPSRAQRVTQPTAMTDAIDAVAEAVTAKLTAEWQAKYDARERYWEGRVKQAGSDRTAENVRRMGAAPQPGGASGARPAAAGAVWGNTPLPDEAWIQKAIRGELANVDLS